MKHEHSITEDTAAGANAPESVPASGEETPEPRISEKLSRYLALLDAEAQKQRAEFGAPPMLG